MCFCTMFSNIYCKIKFRAQNESDQYNFFTRIFGKILIKITFGFSSQILTLKAPIAIIVVCFVQSACYF